MPTPPPLPDAAAQQQAAVEVFAQYEPVLYEAYLDMILEWLAGVQAAMFAGGIARLAMMPDPMTVFSQGPKWAAVTAKYTEQVARDVLATPYTDLFADRTLFNTRPFVQNWIANADNRLSHVPNEVYGLVSHIINAGTTNGASIPDVQAQVEQLFATTGQERWKNRARTVARTEVVGAYNGGLHDAFSMIVESDPGTKYVKRWLATEDQRTRPDHREADGQVVPFGQPFTVGGFQMQHPHDPNAPAKEVVGCRCVELLEEAGDPTPMSNRQYKPTSLRASGMTLMQEACSDGQFCMRTHKPGLCKGQKRGQREPGYVEETKKNPAQRAQTAVDGLSRAIEQAQQVAISNPGNPKLAAAARRAVAGYKKALAPHKQTLKDASRVDKQADRTGQQDARQQDTLDRRAARQKETAARRAARKKESVKNAAQRILSRRAEQKKLDKMSPKQRTAYRKARADANRKQRNAREKQILKEAGK